MICVRVLLILAFLTIAGLAFPGPERAHVQAATPHRYLATPVGGDPDDVPGAVPIYMLVQNSGDRDDRLLHAVSPIAERIEIHRTHLVNGAREMDAVQEGLAIPAGMTVVLEPASYHLMLFGLREDLVQGEMFPLTLRFAEAGDVAVTARVRRKVDAAGVDPVPEVVAGALRISIVSAPPAPAG